MNRHDFQLAAKAFRAGRLTLEEFTRQALAPQTSIEPNVDPSPRQIEVPCDPSAKPNFTTSNDTIVIPTRSEDAHKFLCGDVRVVAGSRTMGGAAALVGLAALRSGAGLCSVISTASARLAIQSASPCLIILDVAENQSGSMSDATQVIEWAERGTVIAIGPGLGKSPEVCEFVTHLYRESPLPMVVDADALNVLAQHQVDWSRHAGPRIVTPHLGEFRKMVGTKSLEMGAARKRAVTFAAEHQVVLVLKGPRTLITDGHQSAANSTGNSGMATAGSGDVLTGIIAGLGAQGLTLWDAGTAGTHLHGLAGDLAAKTKGVHSLIATDLIEFLPQAIQACSPPQ